MGDDSGLGLFASGPLAPGASYSFRFFASGTYTVTDRTTRRTGTVGVPMGSNATTGSPGHTFSLGWGTLPAGYVSDIQLKRPRDSGFSPWRTGQTARNATFTPDDGAGRYQFRARLRRLTTGATSDWSPVRPIEVS